MMKERVRSEILCVEDNDDECDLIKEILTDYEVTCVPTIANACSLLEKKTYSLVILDEHLPDGSGLRASAASGARWKKTELRRHLPGAWAGRKG